MRKVGIALVAFGLVHCATATPVSPAPISAADAPKLEAAVLGTCEVTGTQSPGGDVKQAKGIFFTFKPDGRLHYRIETPLATIDKDWTYRFDGRNIASDGVYKSMRVDDWGGKTLKLFVYDTSDTFYCSK
jgi:hypothetical protein